MSKIKQENIELKEHIEYLETQLKKKQLEFKPVFKCSLRLIVEDRFQVIPTDKYIVDGDTAQFTFEIPNGYFGDQSKQIADLEAKLAEKDEKIKYYKDWLDDVLLTSVDHESYYATINEYEEEINQLKQQLNEKDEEIKHRHWAIKSGLGVQDKISFAIEQLEKVKERVKNIKFHGLQLGVQQLIKVSVFYEIDQQIKQLKEMK